MDFTGSVVAIPGGTGGLGRVVTLSFLRAGATVVTTCVVPSEQDRLATETGSLSARLSCLPGDVTDDDADKRFAGGLAARAGRVAVVVTPGRGLCGRPPVGATGRAARTAR